MEGRRPQRPITAFGAVTCSVFTNRTPTNNDLKTLNTDRGDTVPPFIVTIYRTFIVDGKSHDAVARQLSRQIA